MYLFDEIGIMANMDKKFKIQHKDKIIPNGELKGALKGKGGLIFCKSCNSVYYKKSWHHNLRYYKNLREDLAVSFMLCPACKMIESKKFEGQIVINDLPKNLHENAINLIEAFCHRARQKDPMDRLIDVKKTNGGLTVFTTENQLALRLAHKIKDAFKKMDMKISYSPSPTNAVYVTLTFLPPKEGKISS